MRHLYSSKQQKRKKEEKENLKSESNKVTEVVSEMKPLRLETLSLKSLVMMEVKKLLKITVVLIAVNKP